MKLYGTLPSHFTRKVRVVLQELSIPFDFIPLEHLLETDPKFFAQNPLLQLPSLEDGEHKIIDSDIICHHLLETHGSKQNHLTFFPAPNPLQQRKRLAIMNGGMSAGANLMRAKRGNTSWDLPFFKQERAAMEASLEWLNQDLGQLNKYDPNQLTLLDITLMAFADWAIFRATIPSLEKYPNIARFVAAQKNRPSFLATHPSVPGKV